MIPFTCPRCQTTLSAADEQGGSKINCPKCQQKLMVPQAELNRTMVGKLLPQMAGGPQLGLVSLKEAGPDAKGPTSPPPVTPGTGQGVSATENPQLKVAEWYYTRAGKQCGPVAWAQLRYLTAAGQVLPAERVWTQGMSNWTLASAVQGLFPPASTGAPAPSPARGRKKVWIWAGTAGALAVVLILVLGHPKPEAGPRKELTTREIVACSEKSVAFIKGPLGSGTGFLVAPGILATNAHVMEGQLSAKVVVTFPNAGEEGKKPLTPQVLYFNRKRDLAFIKVNTALPPLPLAKKYKFIHGQDITVIGNPGGLKNAVAKGVMSTEEEIGGKSFYQITIAINPGNSGGPVFDSYGDVIGVVTLKSSKQEGIAFCVPGEDLEAAAEQVKAMTADQITKSNARFNLRAAFARITPAGTIYALWMEEITKAWQEAVRAGTSQDAAVTKARTEFIEMADKKGWGRYANLKDVEEEVAHIGSDTNLPEDLRADFRKLWAVFTDLRSNALTPRGNLTTYQNNTREWVDQFKHVVESLRVTLGVEDEELPLRFSR